MADASPFELKQISMEAVPRAIEKAKHYRDLNDPGPAVSICEDVLAVDPGNQDARVVLVLSLSDQLATAEAGVQRIRREIEKLEDDYARAYYTGITFERQGRAFISRNMAGSFAYEAFRDAMEHYEAAEELAPTSNDDATLRWNCCVREIRARKLSPRVDDDGHRFALE